MLWTMPCLMRDTGMILIILGGWICEAYGVVGTGINRQMNCCGCKPVRVGIKGMSGVRGSNLRCGLETRGRSCQNA